MLNSDHDIDAALFDRYLYQTILICDYLIGVVLSGCDRAFDGCAELERLNARGLYARCFLSGGDAKAGRDEN
jgi:hypothetical protein